MNADLFPGRSGPRARPLSRDADEDCTTLTVLGPRINTVSGSSPSVQPDLPRRTNGSICQSANSHDPVTDIHSIIEWVSRPITPDSGDLSAAGMPEGIGRVMDGEMMTCRAERIGAMYTQVRSQ